MEVMTWCRVMSRPCCHHYCHYREIKASVLRSVIIYNHTCFRYSGLQDIYYLSIRQFCGDVCEMASGSRWCFLSGLENGIPCGGGRGEGDTTPAGRGDQDHLNMATHCEEWWAGGQRDGTNMQLCSRLQLTLSRGSLAVVAASECSMESRD